MINVYQKIMVAAERRNTERFTVIKTVFCYVLSFFQMQYMNHYEVPGKIQGLGSMILHFLIFGFH